MFFSENIDRPIAVKEMFDSQSVYSDVKTFRKTLKGSKSPLWGKFTDPAR